MKEQLKDKTIYSERYSLRITYQFPCFVEGVLIIVNGSAV